MAAYDACPPKSIWTTQDGRKIPVSWMQSQHLCHAFKLAIRNNGLSRAGVMRHMLSADKPDVLDYLTEELQVRGLLMWTDNSQISISTIRETPAQLCMLRAIIDSGGVHALLVGAFMKDRQTMLEWILDKPAEHEDIIARFTEYRLGYPG